ncbi:MAG: hypothetical protein E6R15_06955 [Zoogloea sp.]|nr:MAG: hypothetical protein E6R15_06955 [Zoogloea sp.]
MLDEFKFDLEGRRCWLDLFNLQVGLQSDIFRWAGFVGLKSDLQEVGAGVLWAGLQSDTGA